MGSALSDSGVTGCLGEVAEVREKTKKVVGVMEFRISANPLTGRPMVEVWQDDKFMTGIYAHEDGIRIVSKYLDGIEHEAVVPPSIVIKFSK